MKTYLAIGSQELLMMTECLDVAENVVPPAAIQPHDVVLERVEYFVHLESCQNMLYQDGTFDEFLRQV